jgi:hypothetical protein
MIPGGLCIPLVAMRPTFVKVYSASQLNVNLRNDIMALGWSGLDGANLFITVNSGVDFYSNSPGLPAFDTGALPATCRVDMTMIGRMVGRGGAHNAAGGHAFVLNTSCSFKIALTGIIAAGGGGGGDGGNSADGPEGIFHYFAGGGAGGYGYGPNGATGGSAGGYAFSQGSYNQYFGGTGGTGGGPGLPGSAGDSGHIHEWASNVDYSAASHPLPGGAAGKAIQLNGHPVPTFTSGNDASHIRGAIS